MTDPLAGLDEVDWADLPVAYDDRAAVPKLLRGLAAADPATRADAFDALRTDALLKHAGTVWPATAAAVPFLARLAAHPHSDRRATLINELAGLAFGSDEPHAPAGTALAVRRAVHATLPLLAPELPNADVPHVLALLALACMFPLDNQFVGAPDAIASLRGSGRFRDSDALLAAATLLGAPDRDSLTTLRRVTSAWKSINVGDVIAEWLDLDRPPVELDPEFTLLVVVYDLFQQEHWSDINDAK